jgi:DNA-binding NtrC family response regulator
VDRVRRCEYDAAVIQSPLPDCTIDHLLEQLTHACADLAILVSDPLADPARAAGYMRQGAWDVTDGGEHAIAQIEAVLAIRSRPEEDLEPWRRLLVGTSPPIRRTSELIRLAACRRATVLITGETGTGKELIARALHLAGPRARLPMVAVNVSALPENLLEAELFGHVKGAFTGAVHQRLGRFEQAHRGTLFLDEVGDLPLEIQTKLLRAVQEREFQRVGSSETIHVDVRLIAATHVDLVERIRMGRFREDLYYRLNVISIPAPPLRDRVEDILLLARHFVEKICGQEDISPRRLTPEALARLQSYAWPGNVRQLENAIEMAVAMTGDRQVLYPSDFALPRAPMPVPATHSVPLPEGGINFEHTVDCIARQIIDEALRKTKGNKSAAAEMLGLKRTTLSAKLKSLDAVAGN